MDLVLALGAGAQPIPSRAKSQKLAPLQRGGAASTQSENRLLSALTYGSVYLEVDAVSGNFFLAITVLLGLSLGLSGCNQKEQGRILSYEKGTYLGQVDQKLGKDQLRDLEVRTNMQAWN